MMFICALVVLRQSAGVVRAASEGADVKTAYHRVIESPAAVGDDLASDALERVLVDLLERTTTPPSSTNREWRQGQ